MLVALIALSVALGGSSYAATQLDRAAPTATAKKAKESDRVQDAALARSVVARSLASVSHAYQSYQTKPIAITSTDPANATGVGALLLPKGQYQLIAKVHVFTNAGGVTYTPINCVLSGGGENDTARATLANATGDTDQTLTMLARAQVSTASANVFVACWTDNTGNTVYADVLKIAAIQVNHADSVPSG